MLNLKNIRCEYFNNPIGIGEKKPRFSWVLDSDEKDILQDSYRLQVSKTNCFETPMWDSGKIISENSIHIQYDGPELESRTRYFYRVAVTDNRNNESGWSEVCFFETGIFDTKEWSGDFISPEDDNNSKDSSASYLRKEFNAADDILSARIYATSLGLYQLNLNGTKIGDMLLTPGWTSYHKRLQYQTYDITGMLKTGNNAIGAILGCGWYKGDLMGKPPRNKYGSRTALLMQLHIKYKNGTEQVVVSDSSWKCAKGPILMSEIYHGETYDANLEMPGWDMPGFDDRSWSPAYKLDIDRKRLVAQENVPVREIETITPISLFTTPSGEKVIDMGQNMVGWVRFNVKGPKGSRVILKHAEVLDKNGNVYFENLRAAKQTIEYTLKGEGVEVFSPHFTFQGFRFVRIDEFPGEPSLDNFRGVVIHSDMVNTGSFSCSNELINQLQHNILWGLKGNFVDVPTDCPQRNERCGWTGDAQVFSRTAFYLMNAAPFFKKWLRDLSADQLENGGVPQVIPQVLDVDKLSSGWGDAAVICPWNYYLSYGDTRLLEEQYNSMKGWVEYIRSVAENGLIWNSGFHYGDWLGLDSKEGSYIGATAMDLISTAFYAYSTSLVIKAAKALNKTGDIKEYSDLHSKIVKAFQLEFFTPTGRLAVPTQTAHVLSLMFDLVEDKNRKRTIDTLVDYLEKNKWHLTTGFLGTPYLCQVLSDNGRIDVAYKLLLQTDFPSWLYQVTKGATTIWEHWDGIKPDGSFWSPNMNSFNHYAYGSIGDWMYRTIAGIDMDEEKSGYKHFFIKPQPGGELTCAAAELETMYGKLKSEWKLNEGKYNLEVIIPHNTTATVVLPNAKVDGVTSNTSLSSAKQLTEGVSLELGSGRYVFEYVME